MNSTISITMTAPPRSRAPLADDITKYRESVRRGAADNVPMLCTARPGAVMGQHVATADVPTFGVRDLAGTKQGSPPRGEPR